MKAIFLLALLMGSTSCSILMKKEVEPVNEYIEKMKKVREVKIDGARYIDIPVPQPRS